jgi:hypothetical protein
MEKITLKQLLFVSLLSGTVFAGTTLTKTEVSELYVTLMGRVSEGKGSNYWQNNYSDQTEAAKGMLGSDAVAKYFDVSSMVDMSNEDFIGTIYRNTLNKTKDGSDGTIEDASGIAYWNGRLTGETGAKMSRDEMIVQFITIAQKSTTVSGQQFSNRVEVSNYMADTVETAPDDYETSTSFMGDLIVTSDFGTVASAKGEIGLFGGISIGTPPSANAGADTTILVNQTITLTGIGTDADGTIVSYEWKKGSEVLGASATLEYIPTEVGTDTLTLTVMDDDGASNSDSVEITVQGTGNIRPHV